MNLGKIISRSALYWPDHEALVDNKQRINFAQLELRTNRLASGLLELGLQSGAHLAILALNRVELVEAEIALYKTAMVKVPVNARLSLDEIVQILNDSHSQAAIVEGRFAAALHARRGELPRLRWIVSLDDEAGDLAYSRLLERGSEAPVHSDPADDALAVDAANRSLRLSPVDPATDGVPDDLPAGFEVVRQFNFAGREARPDSPVPGCSTFTTSAPRCARSCVA